MDPVLLTLLELSGYPLRNNSIVRPDLEWGPTIPLDVLRDSVTHEDPPILTRKRLSSRFS
jgi:hypothetical protein